MEVGQNGVNSATVAQAVEQAPIQGLEHVLHQNHLELEQIAKETILVVNRVR
jgi:hypothetical protein